MKKLITLTIAVLIIAGCNTARKKENDKISCHDNTIISIDLDNKVEKQKLLYSKFLAPTVKTILLETNENALISTVSKLRTYKNYIIILDNKAKKLFLFNNDGQFISLIGRMGEGPEEYISLSDFTIDENTGTIFLLDQHRQKVMPFDINTGKYIKEKELYIENETDSQISRSIEYYNGKLYADAYSYKEEDDIPLLRELDPQTGKQLQTFFNLKDYNKRTHRLLLASYPFHKSASRLVFFHPYMHTVILIDEKSVSPYIEIKSSQMLSSEELALYDLENPLENITIKLLGVDKIKGIGDFIDFGKDLIFFCDRGKQADMVWYNTETDESSAISSISDDIVYKDNGFPNFMYADTNGIYGVVDHLMLPIFLRIRDSGGLRSDLDKIEQIQELTEDSNTIIFYYEYK